MRLAANLKRRAEMMSIIGGGLAVRERLGVEFRFKAYAEAGRRPGAVAVHRRSGNGVLLAPSSHWFGFARPPRTDGDIVTWIDGHRRLGFNTLAR